MFLVPPQSAGSVKNGWSPESGRTPLLLGLTVPEFPLLSESPAMTSSPGWFMLGG